MKRAALFALALLSACGPNPATIRPDAGSAEYQVDALQCDYESSAATAGYGSGQNTAGSYGGAAAQGFGAGMGQGLARRDLFAKCMRAKYAARASAAAPSATAATIPYEGKVMFPAPGVIAK